MRQKIPIQTPLPILRQILIISLIQRQILASLTVHQNGISILTDGWFTNTPFFTLLVSTNRLLFLVFILKYNMFKFWSVEVGQVFPVSSKIVHRWVTKICCLTFRHRASSIQDRHFATLQRTLFIYLINIYISLSDICLTCIIDINNIDNKLDGTITAY